MLEELKKEVYEVNMFLLKYNLVIFIWGNVLVIDRESGLIVIKLLGVDYEIMKLEDMVVVDLDGNVVEGKYKLLLDILIYVKLYNDFIEIGGVVYIYFRWVIVFV